MARLRLAPLANKSGAAVSVALRYDKVNLLRTVLQS